jgi:hypothetical protein
VTVDQNLGGQSAFQQAAAIPQQAGPSAIVTVGDTLTGRTADVRGEQGVSVCVGANCRAIEVLGAPVEAHSYDDAPATPIALDAVSCANPLVRSFDVGDSMKVGQVRLALAASHVNRAEVRASLRTPAGTTVMLTNDDGATHPRLSGLDLLIADDAPSALYDSRLADDPAAPFEERAVRPIEPLGRLAGEPAQGQWQLQVCDTNLAANGGAFVRGRLEILPLDDTPRPGSWSFMLPVPDAGADGAPINVTVIGTLPGGVASAPQPVQTLVDTVAPTLTVQQLIQGLPLQGGPATVLRGTASDGGGLAAILVDIVLPTGEIQRQQVRPIGKQWSFTLAPTAVGANMLTVMAVDNAGNVAISTAYRVSVLAPWQIYMPSVAAPGGSS